MPTCHATEFYCCGIQRCHGNNDWPRNATEVGLIVYWLNMLHDTIGVSYIVVETETCSQGGNLQMLPIPHYTVTPAKGRDEREVEMPAAAAVHQVSAAGCNESMAWPDHLSVLPMLTLVSPPPYNVL